MQITRHLVSRRNVLTGIAAAPALAVTGAPIGARAEDIDAKRPAQKLHSRTRKVRSSSSWGRARGLFQVFRAAWPQA